MKKEIHMTRFYTREFLDQLALAKDVYRKNYCDGTFAVFIDFGTDAPSSFWAEHRLHQLWKEAKEKGEGKK